MLLAGILGLMLVAPSAVAQEGERVQVQIVTDEPDAVLAILAKRAASTELADSDWKQLFDSEGYRRLKKREESMHRPFTEEAFKAFVMSPELYAQADKLQETLDAWKQADLTRPANLALAYLPEDATIKATIYPAIKPVENSFVFEVDTNPAIFLYLDTEKTKEDFENTVAHELHHIGFGTACPPREIAADTAKQPERVKMVRKWVSAFGEGFAMLAAAGSPDVHPRATATQEQHERWDMDMGQFYQNRLELDNFFMKILKGELSGDKADAQAFTYFGYQGPWYTVGYRMDVVLEGAIGRQKLIQAMCDGSVLAEYNESVKGITGPRGLPPGKPMWSPEIIKALTVVKPEKTPKAEDKPE